MVNVLLLRQGTDGYEDYFRNSGYNAYSLSASETFYVNLTVLADIIRDGLTTVNGLIVTSQRSCEALGKAFELLKDEPSGKECRNTAIADWAGVPIYVVGEKTASSLRDIFAQYTDSVPDIRGQESGNASNLATFILSDLQDRSGTKLLYLTGDKNRDTITRTLSEHNIVLEPLQVYRMQDSPSFESRLSSLLEMSQKDCTHWWIVYFAPSTASFATPILKNYFHLQEVSPGISGISKKNLLLPTRIAVIGPTTHEFLVDQLHLRVDAMASKPAPIELVSAMQNFDKRGL